VRLLRRISGSRASRPETLKGATYLWLTGRFPASPTDSPPKWTHPYWGLIPYLEYWWAQDSARSTLLNRVIVWEFRRWWIWQNKLGEFDGSLPPRLMNLHPDDLIGRIGGTMAVSAAGARREAAADQRARPGFKRERWSKLRRVGQDAEGTHTYTFLAGPHPRPTLSITGGGEVGGWFVGIDREEWIHAGLAPLSGYEPVRRVHLGEETWEEDCICAVEKAQTMGLHVYTQHIHLQQELQGRGLGAASFLALWDVARRHDPKAAFISGGCQTEATAGSYYLWKYLLTLPQVEDLSCPGDRQVPLARLRRPIKTL